MTDSATATCFSKVTSRALPFKNAGSVIVDLDHHGANPIAAQLLVDQSLYVLSDLLDSDGVRRPVHERGPAHANLAAAPFATRHERRFTLLGQCTQLLIEVIGERSAISDGEFPARCNARGRPLIHGPARVRVE